MEVLPLEILIEILSKLENIELVTVQFVNKLFKKITENFSLGGGGFGLILLVCIVIYFMGGFRSKA